jgi:PEP-CTERM motif
MKHTLPFGLAAITALVIGAIQAQGQSVTFDFSDATPDGWVNGGFSSSPASTVVNITGNNYISLALGGFQVGNVNSGTVSGVPASTFNATMLAALENPSGYELTYNYYINTAAFTGATYLQLSSFVNTGSGYYVGDGTPSPNEPSFNGTQLASGGIFSGSVTVPFTAYGVDANAATETYFRMGLIENGNGTGVAVDYTDISITPVAAPEPATLALVGLGAAGLLAIRRRKA